MNKRRFALYSKLPYPILPLSLTISHNGDAHARFLYDPDTTIQLIQITHTQFGITTTEFAVYDGFEPDYFQSYHEAVACFEDRITFWLKYTPSAPMHPF